MNGLNSLLPVEADEGPSSVTPSWCIPAAASAAIHSKSVLHARFGTKRRLSPDRSTDPQAGGGVRVRLGR